MKSRASFIFLTLFCIAISASAQDILWARQSEDVASLEGVISRKMETDNQGNVIVLYNLAGRVKFEGDLLQSKGMSDILLVKYSSDGFIVWKRVMGGITWDAGADVSIDSKNNILLVGTMPEGGDFIGSYLFKANGISVAAKISPAGDLIWIKQYGGPTSAGNSITADANDNVIVGVRSANYELTIFKYTPSGLLLWQKSLLQNGCCIPPAITDIQIDLNNRIIISGDFFWRLGIDSHILAGTASQSVFICALRDDGTYEWSNVIDAPRNILDEARSVEMDIDESNSIYLTGYFEVKATFGSIVLNAKNSTDDRTTYITKISSVGNFEWANAFYGRDVLPGSIRINHNTHELSVCVSAFLSFNYADQYISSVIGNQSLVLTTDLTGKFKKAFFVSAEAYPGYLASILFTESNEFYVLGSFYADFSVGCFNLDGGSWYTAFLIKSGQIPDIQIDKVDEFCLNEVVRLQVDGSGSDQATKFQWFFPTGVESASGSNETAEKFIDVTMKKGFQVAPFTVVPYYECYPRTEFSSMLDKLVQVPDPPVTPVGDTIICVGKNFHYSTLSVERAIDYEWVLSDDIKETSASGTSILVSTEAIDKVGFIQVKAINECGKGELSSPLRIRLNPAPGKPTVTGPAEVCADESAVSYVAHAETNTITYGWRYPSNQSIKNSNLDSSKVSFTFPKDKTSVIFYALSKGLCRNSISDPIEVKITLQLPALSVIHGRSEICKNTSDVAYAVEAINQKVFYNWFYPNGFTKVSEQDNAIVLEASSEAQSGVVQVSISNRCFTSEFRSFPVTVLTIPDKPSIELGECNKFVQYRGKDNFVWFKNSEMLGSLSPVIEVIDSGYYKIKVSNTCGDSESDEILGYPVIPERLFFPDVITPNHDNLNTYFIVDPSLDKPALEIFDRWGKSVYQSAHYDNKWNGSGLSTGVYYYILSNGCLSKSIKGTIHLLH